MSEQWSDFDRRRGQRDGSVELSGVGRVGQGPGPYEPYLLYDPNGEVVSEVSSQNSSKSGGAVSALPARAD
ncbi:hypothetical protein QFZ40_000704 [Arthrobacter pascens]|uniref:hypothetical protein n=1 Tax=Arthrobacter pascens TaxID=1677 RepID=UPI00278B5984|nr:hypothetical protein [Arthrobacter pascens]MDQ0632795.1 hypothetical protein [Arthrobacter pascens]